LYARFNTGRRMQAMPPHSRLPADNRNTGEVMNIHRKFAAGLIIATAALAGCTNPPNQAPIASPGYGAAPQTVSYGVIDSIQVVQASRGTSGVGTIAGGVVGGALGNQVGGGTGRAAATVAGAVGGALLGNQMEKNMGGANQMYQIGVRLDNGSYQAVQQESIGDLQVGTRVRVENGRVYRY
jgi:outer membrane lipoprotein SlyB